jgi:hypothetical protein
MKRGGFCWHYGGILSLCPKIFHMTNFAQEIRRHASVFPFSGNIKFASGYGIHWQNESTRFVHQCITFVVWPSHARDWNYGSVPRIKTMFPISTTLISAPSTVSQHCSTLYPLITFPFLSLHSGLLYNIVRTDIVASL